MIGLIFLYLTMAFHSSFGQWQTQGFKRTSVACYETLEATKMAKTLIECCSFCVAKDTCHGVFYDGMTCTFLTGVVTLTSGQTEAWIMEQFISATRKFSSLFP